MSQRPASTRISPKSKLSKKYTVNGFQLVDIVWIRQSEGKYKYQVLVRYNDPETPKTKRLDGARQKIIKFGQKGKEDYVDPPHNQYIKQRNTQRLKSNLDNPLHPNFYYFNLLNGPHTDINQNFINLKKQIFS